MTFEGPHASTPRKEMGGQYGELEDSEAVPVESQLPC